MIVCLRFTLNYAIISIKYVKGSLHGLGEMFSQERTQKVCLALHPTYI